MRLESLSLLPSALCSLSSTWSEKISFSNLWQKQAQPLSEVCCLKLSRRRHSACYFSAAHCSLLIFHSLELGEGTGWHAKVVSCILWRVYLLARRKGGNTSLYVVFLAILRGLFCPVPFKYRRLFEGFIFSFISRWCSHLNYNDT